MALGGLALWASATAAKPTDGLGLDYVQALALIAWAKTITESEAAKDRALRVYHGLLSAEQDAATNIATMEDLGKCPDLIKRGILQFALIRMTD